MIPNIKLLAKRWAIDDIFLSFSVFLQWQGKYFVQLAALFFNKLLNYIIIHLHFTGSCSSTDSLV